MRWRKFGGTFPDWRPTCQRLQLTKPIPIRAKHSPPARSLISVNCYSRFTPASTTFRLLYWLRNVSLVSGQPSRTEYSGEVFFEGPRTSDDLIEGADRGNVAFFCGTGVSLSELPYLEGTRYTQRYERTSRPHPSPQVSRLRLGKHPCGLIQFAQRPKVATFCVHVPDRFSLVGPQQRRL